MRQLKFFTIICCSVILISGCSGGSSSGNEQTDYEATKKMVVDLLKTDEGKNAIKDVLADDKIKQNLVMESDVVQQAVEKAMTSDKGKEFWQKLFEDPKFVQAYAKAMQEEEKKLLKGLMKDPDYQKMMLELMQNPEIDKQMITVMKSQQFRTELEKTIKEQISSPLFKAEISDILIKAAEEMKTGKQEGQDKQSGGDGSGGGDSGGGDSGSGGGGQ